jgi:putative addiction module antidote
MLRLKITRVGESAALILPAEVLDRLHATQGDTVCLKESPGGFELTMEAVAFDAEMAAAREVMNQYSGALRKLAE